MKSPGAELSFSSVSVRRGTPVPCGRSPLSPRCWPAYAALWAANRRQIRETLEKPRSRAQLFKRFCAKGDACALRLLTPFFWLLAGLSGHSAANRRLTGKRPKSQGAELQLFGRFCALGMRRGFCPAGFLPAAGNRRWDFSLPGKTEAQRGLAPGTSRVRARLGAGTNPVRDLLGAAAG